VIAKTCQNKQFKYLLNGAHPAQIQAYEYSVQDNSIVRFCRVWACAHDPEGHVLAASAGKICSLMLKVLTARKLVRNAILPDFTLSPSQVPGVERMRREVAYEWKGIEQKHGIELSH